VILALVIILVLLDRVGLFAGGPLLRRPL
jgi:hypothetical protein